MQDHFVLKLYLIENKVITGVKWYYIFIRQSIHQENILIWNQNLPNKRAI